MLSPKIIKAEILITRRCNLSCSYCNMPANKVEIPASDWIDIFNILTDQLSCPFYPIYGAEPLLYPGIYDVIRYFADSKKNACSILTNATLLTDEVKHKLLDSGLNSITLSVDGLSMEERSSVAFRNSHSLKAIDWALKGGIPDIQGTSTVHKLNIRNIPNLVRFLSARGVWYSFDFIHDNKSEDGHYPELSKVNGRSDLSFDFSDMDTIMDFLYEMRVLKESGYKIYQSLGWFDYLLTYPEQVVHRGWFCNRYPSWVTIDSDGQVLVCDDYLQPSGIFAKNLPDRWDDLIDFKDFVVDRCRGCIWSTHWMSQCQLIGGDGFVEVSHGRL